MNTSTGTAIFLMLFLISPCLSLPHSAEAVPLGSTGLTLQNGDALKIRIDDLIEQLNSDDIGVRNNAADQLRTIAKQDVAPLNLTKQELQAALLLPRDNTFKNIVKAIRWCPA